MDCSLAGSSVHGILQAIPRAMPCPPRGDLANPGFKSKSPMSPVFAGGFFTSRVTWEAQSR